MATIPSLVIVIITSSQVEHLEQVRADGQWHILEVTEWIG
jgi:hypothetical protein